MICNDHSVRMEKVVYAHITVFCFSERFCFYFLFSLFADQAYLLFGFCDRFYDLDMLKDGLFFFGLMYLSKD